MKKNNIENSMKNMTSKLEWFKNHWAIITTIIITQSLIFLFIVSFVFNKNIELVTMNNWISLILGFVATFLSIISMLLSFYNLEKSNELNLENSKSIILMQDTLIKNMESLNNIDEYVDKFHDLVIKLDKSSSELLDFRIEIIQALKKVDSHVKRVGDHMNIDIEERDFDDIDFNESDIDDDDEIYEYFFNNSKI